MKKICKGCKIEKDIDEFHSNGKNKDGSIKYKARCKKCQNSKRKELYSKNKDAINKRRRESSDKDAINKYSAKYREKNRDAIRRRDRIYYARDKYNCSEYYDSKKEYRNKVKQKELDELNTNFAKFVEDNPEYHNYNTGVWTYIIKADSFWKIGITSQLSDRVSRLKRHIEIIDIYILPIDIEKRLHIEFNDSRFSHKDRFGGYTECFNITDEQAIDIVTRERFKKY